MKMGFHLTEYRGYEGKLSTLHGTSLLICNPNAYAPLIHAQKQIQQTHGDYHEHNKSVV